MMSDSTYPYVNHMNILPQALERIDIAASKRIHLLFDA